MTTGNTPPKSRNDLSKLIIKPLDSKTDRAAFSCDNPELDSFFREHAWVHHERHWARVYVAFLHGRLVGYYWLVTQSHPPKKISEDDHTKFGKFEFVPCVYLGMLAIQKEFQGGGIGKTLMLNAFEKTLEIADRAGVYALTLEAVDEKTAQKYEGWGFQRFFDGKLLMFIPVITIRRALPLVPPTTLRSLFRNFFPFARR